MLMSPTRGRREIQKGFHQAALQAYQRHGFRSYRHAEQVTGLPYSTIYALVSRGRIPTRGQVIDRADRRELLMSLGIEVTVNTAECWAEVASDLPTAPVRVPIKRRGRSTE